MILLFWHPFCVVDSSPFNIHFALILLLPGSFLRWFLSFRHLFSIGPSPLTPFGHWSSSFQHSFRVALPPLSSFLRRPPAFNMMVMMMMMFGCETEKNWFRSWVHPFCVPLPPFTSFLRRPPDFQHPFCINPSPLLRLSYHTFRSEPCARNPRSYVPQWALPYIDKENYSKELVNDGSKKTGSGGGSRLTLVKEEDWFFKPGSGKTD